MSSYTQKVIAPYVPLWQIKSAIEHTCLHEEEPCFSESCINHIVAEVDKISDRLYHVHKSIIFISPYCSHREKIIEELDKGLDEMMHTVDTLHEVLRNPSGRTAASVQQHLNSACVKFHAQYHKLCDKMEDLGAVSEPMMKLFYIE